MPTTTAVMQISATTMAKQLKNCRMPEMSIKNLSISSEKFIKKMRTIAN